jgi:hypothetical protein
VPNLNFAILQIHRARQASIGDATRATSAAEFRKFLDEIEAAVPGDLDVQARDVTVASGPDKELGVHGPAAGRCVAEVGDQGARRRKRISCGRARLAG